MSGLQYLEYSYNKERRFENGSIKLELHPDGVLIHGTVEVEADPPLITFCDRIVHWHFLDSSRINVLEHDIGLVVETLRLVEMTDAGG